MRRTVKEYIFKLSAIALVIFYCLHASSCANTTGAPTGGPQDTIPPVILGTSPAENATNVPVSKSEIVLTFNEYVQIKDGNRNIFLSPPQKKSPVTKIKGKNVVITFPEDLDSNTTYALNFGKGLADNNEGNVLWNYVYSFSTGDTVDSMLISGTVVDYETLKPLKDVSVALYEVPTDSCVITTLPSAITRSDDWGYFCVRNLKSVPYAVFAFKDEIQNHKYDIGNEVVGFLDSMVVPTIAMNSELPQLATLDMKDTIACLSRPAPYTIFLFREKGGLQYISSYKMFSKKGAYIKFNSPDAIIEEFSIDGIAPDKLYKQFNKTNDSLVFWMDASIKERDTMKVNIKYHKTDSLGNLVATNEELLITPPIEKEQDKAPKKDSEGKTIRKDLLTFNLNADPKSVEQDGYVFEFSDPLLMARFDTISLVSSTPKGVKTDEAFTVIQDSTEIRRYILRPNTPFIVGNDYIMNIPEGVFRDINGFTNDSLENKLILPTSDNASSITLDMHNVNARYIVELISEKRDKVYRKYIINRDSLLLFPYLEKGNYSVRVTEDKNSNEILDPGSILDRRQPEMVRLYTLPDKKEVIVLEERTDIEQSIDVRELFEGNEKLK